MPSRSKASRLPLARRNDNSGICIGARVRCVTPIYFSGSAYQPSGTLFDVIGEERRAIGGARLFTCAPINGDVPLQIFETELELVKAMSRVAERGQWWTDRARVYLVVVLTFLAGMYLGWAGSCSASESVERVADGHGGTVVIDYRTLAPAQSYSAECFDAETNTPTCGPITVGEQAHMAAAEDVLWRRMPWYERIGWGGYAIGNAADIGTTAVALKHGCREANPFVKALFGAKPTVPQMAALSVGTGWLITYIAHKRNLNARRVAGVVGVAHGVAAISNIATGCVL